jgi:hypothetical protein
MKKLFETTFNNGILKDYRLNKDYDITVIYKDDTTIEIRLFDHNGTFLSDMTVPKANLSEVKDLALEMVNLYLNPPKIELQQIKDILVESITIEQAEKYSYVAIDQNSEIWLFIFKPEIDCSGVWNNPSDTTGQHQLTVNDYVHLLSYVSTSIDLLFLIADLKGQN